MKHDPLIHDPDGCEAFQQQLSEIADSGVAPTPGLQAHLHSCARCAGFAEQWLHGPPVELAQTPAAAFSDGALRERILSGVDAPTLIRFPAPAAGHQPWVTWLGRLAACLALAGFSYWLLNPVASPVRHERAPASGPTLTQSLTQMNDQTKREQEALQTALVDGGSQVRGDLAWSVSALEL